MSFYGRNYVFNVKLTTTLLSSILNATARLRDIFRRLKQIEDNGKKGRMEEKEIIEYISLIYEGIHATVYIHEFLDTLLYRDKKKALKTYEHIYKTKKKEEKKADVRISILKKKNKKEDKAFQEKEYQEYIKKKEDYEKKEKIAKEEEEKLRRAFMVLERKEELSAKHHLREIFNTELLKDFDIRKSKMILRRMIYRDIKLDWKQKEVNKKERILVKHEQNITKKNISDVKESIKNLLKDIKFEYKKDGTIIHRLVMKIKRIESSEKNNIIKNKKIRDVFERYDKKIYEDLRHDMKENKRKNMDMRMAA